MIVGGKSEHACNKARPVSIRRPGRFPAAALLALLILLSALSLGGCAKEPDPEPLASLPAGTWYETTKIAEKDGKPHPVEVIVDRFVRDADEVAAFIEAYNLSATGPAINPLDNPDLEFCVMEYRVKFPKDFPQRRDGILDVAIPFEIVSLYGDEIKVGDTVYPNLATTVEIGEQPQGYDFHRGDTYTGRIVFAMVKGFDGYLVREIRDSDGGAETWTLIRGE